MYLAVFSMIKHLEKLTLLAIKASVVRRILWHVAFPVDLFS